MGAVDPEKVLELLAQAEDLEHGPSRMAVADEAVRLADTLQDLRLGYDARVAVVEAAVFGGYPEKALVAFGWLCATSDRDPQTFPERRNPYFEIDLLWMYKWIVQNTSAFPQISRAQIERTVDEMEVRYARCQLSLRPVSMSRVWVGMELGDPAADIRDHFNAWKMAPRDVYADCAACEQNFRVEVHRYLGESDAEWRAARPLLAGELSCAEVPHLTISNLVMSAWERGDAEQAALLHARGYEMCRTNRDFVVELAEHVDYRIVTGDLDGALTMAERHLSWVEQTRAARRQWRWFVTLGELFAALEDSNSRAPIRIPAALAPSSATNGELARWFASKADELSATFDARNQNNSVSARAQELRDRLSRR